MVQVIIGFLNIVFLLLKNKFEKDEKLKKEKENLHEEAKEAIKSGDISRINSLIGKLRK